MERPVRRVVKYMYMYVFLVVCQPTESYGGPCGQLSSDYIKDCDYNGAYEILEHIYGGLQVASFPEMPHTRLHASHTTYCASHTTYCASHTTYCER